MEQYLAGEEISEENLKKCIRKATISGAFVPVINGTAFKNKGVQIHLPIDSIIADKFAADAATKVADNTSIESGWMGLDIGPETITDVQNNLENCKTIIITEKYNGTEVSISLKRKQDIISWKRGAWVDDNDISYKNPNDCWKKLIANHFGEIGLKKFYGQNVWGKTGRLIAITNRGNIFDINKNPMRVIMDLEKCKGSYCGREFSSYKEEDFIQMV
jgi:hypothetical protein